MKRISIAFDHRGEKLASVLRDFLKKSGYEVSMGTSRAGDDYIDNAIPAINDVKSKKSDFAILICGTGVGMAIVANRHSGIFAVHAKEPAEAHFARVHENANVLVLGAGYADEQYEVKLSSQRAKQIVQAFLTSNFEGGRHQRRVEKIERI